MSSTELEQMTILALCE